MDNHKDKDLQVGDDAFIDDLREALQRREARRTKRKVPLDFCDSVMQEIAPTKKGPRLMRYWIAAAASLLIIIGIGGTLWLKEEPRTPMVAEANMEKKNNDVKVVERPLQEQIPTKDATKITPKEMPISKHAPALTPSPMNSQPVTSEPSVRPARTLSDLPNKDIHYAAMQTTEDTLTYQDPARVNEFISKLAQFNGVEELPLECNSADSTIVGKAYIFDDTKELDLFGRLLQVACWYDSKTPGYLLNFTHQQLYFTLKDLRKGRKYLWIAERTNGNRILLQSIRSSMDVTPSSACYQDYRNNLPHQVIHHQQNI